jgi:uncharacterized membrane protein (UPF0127 family)
MKIVLRSSATPNSPIQCEEARGFMRRAIGLLGRAGLSPNSGLVIEPCQQVHTFFMRFPIDVVFLSKDNEIVGVESLKPWRLSKLYFKARKVVEIEHHRADQLGWTRGQKLELGHD